MFSIMNNIHTLAHTLAHTLNLTLIQNYSTIHMSIAPPLELTPKRELNSPTSHNTYFPIFHKDSI